MAPRTTTLLVAGMVLAAAVAVTAMPDLTLDADRLRNSLSSVTRAFSASSCAVAEDCVTGTGNRRLMQFDTVTPNVGTTDLVLGAPGGGDPRFVYDSCHRHYHWIGYAVYNMYDLNGAEVTYGRKQAFCLLDSGRYHAYAGSGVVPPWGQYHCGYQGISVGYMDVYGRGLDCQWIDITGVPSGLYNLRVELNAPNAAGQRRIQESNYANNVFTIPVTITDTSVVGGHPTGCVVGAWSAWTACSTTCNGGVRSRTRTVTGVNCGDTVEYSSCNTHACDTGGSSSGDGSDGGNTGGDGPTSTDGRCGANSPVGATCPTGECCSQYGWCGTSAAHCSGSNNNGGNNGGSDSGSDSGSDGGSDSGSDGGSDGGSDSGSDSGSDTGGDNGGAGHPCNSCWPGTSGFCKGANGVCYDYFPGTTMCPGGTTSCYVPLEDHDCQISPWSAWTTCSASCGGGTQTRMRIAEIPQQGNGAPCPEPWDEERACNTHPCDGSGSNSGSDSGSTSGSDSGSTSGSDSGSSSGSDSGNGDVDCLLSEWGAYSTCDVDCGGGTQTRYRSVVVAPQGNGAACGDVEESRSCNTDACDTGNGDQCANCWPGTSGPCQSYNSVCWSFVGGADGKCPPGTSRCVQTGSVPAPPRVEFSLTLAGVTGEEFLSNSDQFVQVLASHMEADPNTIRLSAVTVGQTEETVVGSDSTGHRRLHGGPSVPAGTDATIVSVDMAASQLYGNGKTAEEHAGNIQKLVGDGALYRALTEDSSMHVSATQMNTGHVVVYNSQGVASPNAAASATASGGAAASGQGFALSAVAVALIAVGAAVVGAAVAAGVVAHRSRDRQMVRVHSVSVMPKKSSGKRVSK